MSLRQGQALNERFDLSDNGCGIDAVLREQFVGLAGARQIEHGQFVHADALGAELTRYSVAQSAFGVMVFDRQRNVVGFDAVALITSLPGGFTLIQAQV